MNRGKTRAFLIGGALGLLVLPATAGAAGTASPSMLADTCAGCHGTDGKSPGPIPPLYGMSSEHLASAMRLFRSGQRKSSIMGRIAKGYSDAEIEAMAKHFAGIK